MLNSYVIFLLESSICLLIFAAFYKLFLEKLTFFQWMRFYLTGSLVLSVTIPLLNIPVAYHTGIPTNNSLISGIDRLMNLQLPENNQQIMEVVPDKTNYLLFLSYAAIICYFLIVTVKLVQLARKLLKIKNLISSNGKTKELDYWLVSTNIPLQAFSFFRYIFINRKIGKLEEKDLDIIMMHESIHVRQLHSVDILLTEVFLIVFWFNPVMYIYKKYIHEIHEFIVDEELHKQSSKKVYSNLLLNLAVENNNISPFLGFSSLQIQKRIQMLNKPKSKAMKKRSFILIIPLIAVMLLSFSISKRDAEKSTVRKENSEINKLKIGKIEWEGNSVFSSEQLNKLLGYKKGDDYNHDVYNKIMNGGDIQTLYQNNGFVFYKGDYEENIDNGIVNLKIKIYEGIMGKIGIIALTGTTKNSEEQIIPKLSIESGDFFSKSKIGKSVSTIEKLEKLSGDKVDVRVIPEQNKLTDDGYAIVDLEFVIAKK